MGPLAGLMLHRLVLKNTLTFGRDQDHLKIIHLSFSDMIPDRTESLFEMVPENPALGMAAVISAGDVACEKLGCTGVAGIPCNTFHAPPIWNLFKTKLNESGSNISVLNMIQETADYISRNYSSVKKVGVLSTTGTQRLGIYATPLREIGFTVLEPENQDEVHNLIYNKDWGIKSSIEISTQAREGLSEQIRLLEKKGAELIILACTELPLAIDAKVKFSAVLLDPMVCLARALIKRVDPNRLKSLL
ncbi:MAG: aspartate/glutamate racemase family protein [Spirochaetales bacterium]|nr:aspartate/glutamate racemase family protein [Spirochaetales bacterium]